MRVRTAERRRRKTLPKLLRARTPQMSRNSRRSANWPEADMLPATGSQELASSFSVGDSLSIAKIAEQLGGVDLVVLSLGLTSGSWQALLGALRSAPQSSTANPLIRVIALCTPMREAPLDGEAVRSVPWPIPFEGLVEGIEAMLAGCLPSGFT
jgi:hypothetical protein